MHRRPWRWWCQPKIKSGHSKTSLDTKVPLRSPTRTTRDPCTRFSWSLKMTPLFLQHMLVRKVCSMNLVGKKLKTISWRLVHDSQGFYHLHYNSMANKWTKGPVYQFGIQVPCHVREMHISWTRLTAILSGKCYSTYWSGCWIQLRIQIRQRLVIQNLSVSWRNNTTTTTRAQSPIFTINELVRPRTIVNKEKETVTAVAQTKIMLLIVLLLICLVIL
jgi:hypothetical protein